MAVTRVDIARSATPSTTARSTIALRQGAFSSAFSSAFAGDVTASTQDHGAIVAQATSGKTLMLAGGSRGSFRHQYAAAQAGARGAWLHSVGYQRTFDRTRTVLAKAITASTQDHNTQVTQTASGKKLIRADGERGIWLNIAAAHDADVTTPVTPFVASTAVVYVPMVVGNVDVPTIPAGTAVFAPNETAEVLLPALDSTATLFAPTAYLEPHALVTRMARHTLGNVAAAPTARTTRVARHTLGPAPPASTARITRIVRHVLGPPKEAVFQNADNFGPLSWVEITLRESL